MIPSRLLQKNINLVLPLCAILSLIGNNHQKAIAQQIQIIGISPNNQTPEEDSLFHSNKAIPPLPSQTPATDTITINGNPTPNRPSIPSNVKGIGSSQSLPSPPDLSEPYRNPENSTNIVSPLNQTPPTTSVINNSTLSNNNNTSSIPVMVSSPNSISNDTQKNTETNSTAVNNDVATPIQKRRSLREIMVFETPSSTPNSNGNETVANIIPRNDNISSAFRVFVRVNNPNEESRVKEIYPDAFRSNYQGNLLWQVGLFSTRQNAEQAAQPLRNVGLTPILAPVN